MGVRETIDALEKSVANSFGIKKLGVHSTLLYLVCVVMQLVVQLLSGKTVSAADFFMYFALTTLSAKQLDEQMRQAQARQTAVLERLLTDRGLFDARLSRAAQARAPRASSVVHCLVSFRVRGLGRRFRSWASIHSWALSGLSTTSTKASSSLDLDRDRDFRPGDFGAGDFRAGDVGAGAAGLRAVVFVRAIQHYY
eukprot:tig00000492_g1538.t1